MMESIILGKTDLISQRNW